MDASCYPSPERWALLPVYASQRRFVAVLVYVLDAVLVEKKVGASHSREFDALAVIPFHDSAQHFAVVQNYRHRRPRLNLLHVIKIFCVVLVGWRWFFPRRRHLLRSGMLVTRRSLHRARNRLLFLHF